MKISAVIIFILSFVWVCYGGQAAGDGIPLSGGEKVYRLGVQIDTSRDDCLKAWQPLADYLSKKVPGCSFRLIPLKIGIISYAIENGDVDFLICNPAFFAIFCEHRDVSLLATRINNDTGKPFSRYAGVIFCRADNNSIYSIHDLKGKVFSYPNSYSLGGWLAVWREMLKQDFNPKKDIKELHVSSMQGEVVLNVLNGKADAGSVRSDVLVIMAHKGIVDLNAFRIINPKNDDFDLPHSTECYPEWGVIQLQHVPDGIANKVTVALLQMKPDDPAALAAEIAGWCPPENYQQVIECLKELKIGPYAPGGNFSWADSLEKYGPIAAVFIVSVMATAIILAFAFRAKGRYRNLTKELSGQNDRLIMIFKNAREGLAWCNDRDDIVYANPAFCSLAGLASEEPVAGNILRKFPTDLCNTVSKLLAEYRRRNSTQPVEIKYCISGVDVLLQIRPFYNDNTYMGSLFCLADVKDLMTARKETAAINRELEDSIRRSNRLASRALQSAKSKTVSLAALSRDIRTPMSGIMGLIDIIENTDLQPQQRNYVGILKNTAETLITLLDKAFDMSRIETEEAELERILFNVREKIAQIEELFRFRAEEKGLALICTFNEDVPEKICNSPDRLRQVLINVMNNAIGYTNKGRININVTMGKPAKNGCEINFSVSDTGIGISPDKLEKIFEDAIPDENPLNVHRGTGLGLVISRKIARLMGGDLTVESSPGIGSTFTLTILDFHGDGIVDETRRETAAPTGSAGMLKGLRVLIAEDNQVNRLVLDQILLKHGCDVTCVENGRDAVEEAKNGNYDIILMDCHMPILDGFEATLEIRGFQPPLCELPILAITANALPQIKNYCFRCGMNGYISKPFSAETLKSAIVRCLMGYGGDEQERRAAIRHGTETIDVDQQALAERIGKNGDVMKRVVKLFLDDCVKSIDQLRQCFNDNNMEQAAAVSHSLKGSSALAGATRIQNAAMEAEQAALDANREYLGKVIEIIEECFKKYKSAVATCI